MKIARSHFQFLLCCFAFSGAPTHSAFAADASPADIAKRSFLVSKVADSTSESSIRLINKDGQERTRQSKGWSKLQNGSTDNQSLVIFESPADVRGMKNLVIEHSKGDDDIWVYIPAMKKVRRLVSSNKKDSYAGTDFSYGDYIGHRVEDWNQKLVRTEKVDGRDCYVLEQTPARPQVASDSGYSKRISWIDKETFVGLKGEAYDTSGQLLKRFFVRKVKKVDEKQQKYVGMEIEGQNVQSGHRTIIQHKDFKANVGVNDSLFTARSLEKP